MRGLTAAAALALAAGAEQIHLSLTGVDTEMHVSWVDLGACSGTGSTIAWGPSTSLPNPVTVKGYNFLEASICVYDYTMTNLQPQTKYYYKAGNAAVYSFTNQPVRAGGKIYAVYADFGLANDVSLTQLITEAAAGQYDAVIHAGDWAYNLEYNGGTMGNDFMNAIEPIAATMPYMGAPGNHESDSQTFAAYKARMYGLATTANNSKSDSLLWYSFNDGLVHWYSIDTELWSYGGTPAQIADQYTWLTNDLSTVDRTSTPWVIGFGHKQRWMDKVNFTGLDAIITQGKTDLYFCGHQHNYQRLYPTYDTQVETACMTAGNTVYNGCKLPITIVAGSPGCRENLSTGAAPANALIKQAIAYGYGHLTINNATHVLWQWEEIAAKDDAGRFVRVTAGFADEATIIKA